MTDTEKGELELLNQQLLRAREDLERSLRRYRELFEWAPDGSFTLGLDGAVHEANPAGAALMGVERAGLIGHQLSEFVFADKRVAFEAFVRAVLLGDEHRQTCEVHTGTRGERSLEVAARSGQEEGNGRVARLGAIDISERVATELARERRLVQAEKQEAIGRLAGGLAHDLNNTLGIILGTAELALTSPCTDPVHREDLLAIQSAAKCSASLAQDLLTMAGQESAAPIPLNVNVAIERELPALNQMLGDRVQLDYRPEPELPEVMLDLLQMRQLIDAVARNARDFIGEAGKLFIRTGKVILGERETEGAGVSPGTFVMLSMGHTGRGLDEVTRAHIFDPYFPRPDHKRAGLGLAPVLGILKQNHGFAQVESPPGEGATYRMFFPRCPELLQP